MSIQEQNKNIIQIWVIIALVIVVGVMGYLLWKDSSNETKTNETVVNWEYEKLTLTIIDDKRCWAECPTDDLIMQLKTLNSISSAEIVRKDFSDEWVAEYLKENEIDALPLLVFSTNNFDTTKDQIQYEDNWEMVPSLNKFLQKLPKWDFYLDVRSVFNPFLDRSERWFLQGDNEKIQAVIDGSYINGNKDAKITWIEYSDLECPFCAKLHKNGTVEELIEKYGDDLKIAFNHFPLGFHENAQTWAEILECLGEQKWSEAFYELLYKSFGAAEILSTWNIDTSKSSSKDFLIEQAVALWANEADLNTCLDEWKYTKKVTDMQNAWAELFGISWTPWNILINNQTGEYEIISWAYPTESFVEIIDRLMK